MRRFITVLCLIWLTTPLFGQQAMYRPGRFSFTTPLQIAITQDNNFLTDKRDLSQRLFLLSLPPSVQFSTPDTAPKPINDQVLTLTVPTLAFWTGTPRYEVTASYMPEFEIFRKNGEQNAWNHEAAAEFAYFLGRRTRFIIRDDYRGSQDPSRVLQTPFLLLPRSSFRQNAISTNVEVEVSPLTALSVEYDNTITTFGQSDPLQSRILDTITNGVSFTAKRMLTRKQRLNGTYSVYKIKPINNKRLNDDKVDAEREFEQPIQSVNLQYRYNFSPSSVLELSGGVTSLDNGTSYLMRVGGYRRIGEFWLGGGYSRELSIVADPSGIPFRLGAANFYDLFSVRLSGQPTQTIGLQFEMAGTVNASRSVATGGRSLLSSFRIDHRLTDRTVTFASVEVYHQPWNDYVRAPVSRNRFTVGMEFSFASEAARRSGLLNQDERYVALTDHGRRRRAPE
jgi:hypothetical protein